MTTYRRSAAFIAVSVTAAATALTGAVTPSAHADGAAGTAAPATASVPALDWQPCAEDGGPAAQECAELPVPLDYRRPDGPQLGLAVTRVRSDRPSARRGTLLVIPGGPGSSGVQRVTQKGRSCSGRRRGSTTSSASTRVASAEARRRAAGSPRRTGSW